MEAVGAVASIITIIALVDRGLQSIMSLKQFCHDFSEEAKDEFLRNLDVSASVLVNVKDLCNKAKNLSGVLYSDLRTSSLQIQVDDCTSDLETWLNIAKKLKKKSNDKKRVLRVLVFNTFLTAISKASRMKVNERIRRHGENIRTALSIFGRQFDCANANQLLCLESSVTQLSQQLHIEGKDWTQQLDSISSKGSSLLVCSKSAGERLKEVQSDTNSLMQEIRGMKSLLVQISSSKSSLNGSEHSIPSEVLTRNGSLDGHRERSPQEVRFLTNAHHDLIQDKAVDRRYDLNQESMVSEGAMGEKFDTEPGFSILHRAARMLVNTTERVFEPLMAQYVSASHAWSVLQYQSLILKLRQYEDPVTHTVDWSAQMAEIRKMRKDVAIQVLSLRKRCRAEGFSKSLDFVDSRLNISDHVIKSWSLEAERKLAGESSTLVKGFDSQVPTDNRKDGLTRLNEWMLLVLYSSSYLTRLSQWMILYSFRGLRETFHIDLTRHYSGDEWRRETLKFWFLDEAAMTTAEYATSFCGLSVADTEATVVLYENEIKSELIDDLLLEPVRQVRQPDYPDIAYDNEDNALVGQPHDSADEHAVCAARISLEDYKSETTEAPLSGYLCDDCILKICVGGFMGKPHVMIMPCEHSYQMYYPAKKLKALPMHKTVKYIERKP